MKAAAPKKAAAKKTAPKKAAKKRTAKKAAPVVEPAAESAASWATPSPAEPTKSSWGHSAGEEASSGGEHG